MRKPGLAVAIVQSKGDANEAEQKVKPRTEKPAGEKGLKKVPKPRKWIIRRAK